MSVTDSSLLGIGGAPLEAASFHFSAMRNTNSTLLGLVGTSLEAALFICHLCTMCDNPPTHGDQQITIVEEAHPSSRYATPFPLLATSHFYIITMM